ncbi:zinc finger OZF-like [Octopus vulgaris]|uniref:Zinc finger OZF-like n=1 Tax=Octopus vulgaris TaxID=6645 RepID=A0AA36F824_OCTVU|nr:zinc finger OZF-like [Octopus vulgaris]
MTYRICVDPQKKSYLLNINKKTFTQSNAILKQKMFPKCWKKKYIYSKTITKLSKSTLTSQKVCKCSVCGKIFSQNCHMTKHKCIHRSKKKHYCDICGRTFSESSTLTNHKRIHTGEKPYNCDMCGKSFSQSDKFAIHKRIHTGEKPYQCGICAKTFSRSFDLNRPQGHSHK